MAPTVFITGASGFVGTCTTLELVKQGYKVKAAARGIEHASAHFAAKYPEEAKSVEWTPISSITDLEAMTAAAAGCDYMLHLASPYILKIEDNVRDMLSPARDGTVTALRAANVAPSIKRVVIISSFAAINHIKNGLWPEHTYTEADCNPSTWDEAVASNNGSFVYCASKEIAENAAWEFMETEKPHFTLTTFCPPMIYGPPFQPVSSLDRLNTSLNQLWTLWSGKAKEVPPTGLPCMVDVRDLAYVMVNSIKNPECPGQRFLVVGDHFSLDQAVFWVAEAFPEQAARMPKTDGKPARPHYKTDSSKAKKTFGIEWRSAKTTFVDTACALFEIEKELEKK
ncbi:NAD(P)-binding protein [Calocera cornea HHB12733]|uniref:NAD(P)-binding protein n=1 Tax=Calocera cornea HHB12733 TaxID=1353952 RepID=A0A165FJZ4_9BASI|nr:NAD(P)-binding protein [Calocera cornea HHB12733]